MSNQRDSQPMSNEGFTERLRKVIARAIGATATAHDLKRLTGGANKTTWSFDADVGGVPQPLILQIATEIEDPVAGFVPGLEPEEDARVIMAAVAAGVPAPHIRAVLETADGLGRGYVTERVSGEALGARIVRDAQYAGARTIMARQCGEILAAIHSVDGTALPFLVYQDAAAHVAAHRRIVDHYGFRSPALELGLRWAAENAPPATRHTVVHGDFRSGNLIVGPEGVRCVLDWELAQSGDPMQDLGWLCVKTWRFGGTAPVGGFGSREDLFAAYEHASGYAVDPRRVHFWEAFGNVKWAIDCLRLGARGVEEIGLERCAIGRRIEEPLWDFFNLIDERS
ncbi:MAG: phosphotransferase family protein, partial [Candidatus Binataceae bacterium]